MVKFLIIRKITTNSPGPSQSFGVCFNIRPEGWEGVWGKSREPPLPNSSPLAKLYSLWGAQGIIG